MEKGGTDLQVDADVAGEEICSGTFACAACVQNILSGGVWSVIL